MQACSYLLFNVCGEIKEKHRLVRIHLKIFLLIGTDFSPITDEKTNKFTVPHSFIPLACAECNNSLPFSGASSIPLCYILFPATLLHQLFFHPPHFIFPSISWSTSWSFLFQIHIQYSFGNSIFFHSLYMSKPT
jgi:hypothetical protein